VNLSHPEIDIGIFGTALEAKQPWEGAILIQPSNDYTGATSMIFCVLGAPHQC
jgi:hypothetical protein